jgi:hypothetical protein
MRQLEWPEAGFAQLVAGGGSSLAAKQVFVDEGYRAGMCIR